MKKRNIIILFIIIIVIFSLIFAVFKFYNNKVYNKEIKSITIKYYEGYNMATGDAISSSIPLNKITLKSNDLKQISKLINKLTKIPNKNSEEYNHIKNDEIKDKYMIEINKSFIIYIGNKYGVVNKNDYYFKVPKELYDNILKIVNEYNDKYLYQKINSKKITIISNSKQIQLTDEKQINELSNYKYYVTNITDESTKNEQVVYTLDLNDGRKIDVYIGSIACMYYKDGTHKYIYVANLQEFIDNLGLF